MKEDLVGLYEASYGVGPLGLGSKGKISDVGGRIRKVMLPVGGVEGVGVREEVMDAGFKLAAL